MLEHPRNKKNITFTWLSSLYNPCNGLKHCVAIRPKESEMILIMEDIYYQIMRHNVKDVIFQQND